MSEWFDDDSFWDTLAPFLFSVGRDDARTETEADALRELLAPTPGAAVLDMPCGTGRHSAAWAARGFAVTGVDRSPRYLALAGERAAARGVSVTLEHADMRAFRRPATFELALNLFTSLGYFADPADDIRVLRNIHDSLVPGGRLVVETAGKEIFARTFRPRTWDQLPGTDQFLLEEHSFAAGLEAVENRWIWIGGAERREFRFRLRIYSGAELAAALQAAGFAEVKLHGDLGGAPYDLDAKRLVAVATRRR
ncbi:MAG: methyltransferase domain-containing protein [bacterium]